MSTPASKRQRLLLLVAAAGLGLLALDRVLFTPLGRMWQAHRAEINALHLSLINGHSLVDRAGQLQRSWAAM